MVSRKQNARDNQTPAPASSRAMYISEIRHYREKAGMTQDELAAQLFLSRPQITHVELGHRRLPEDCAARLDEIFATDGFFARNLEAGRSTPYREHFADVAELEAFALSIREWEPLLMPGLLQTPAYARAVIRGYDPVIGEKTVKERLAARLARAKIFDNPDTPMYWAVVDEAAIRRPVGGPAVMAEQLRHVSVMIRRERALVQVMPFSAGSHAGMGGALKLMTFEDDAPLAYAQAQETGSLLDDPATVKRCSLTYDLLAAAALSPEASLSFIEAVAEEYEHGPQARPDGGDVA